MDDATLKQRAYCGHGDEGGSREQKDHPRWWDACHSCRTRLQFGTEVRDAMQQEQADNDAAWQRAENDLAFEQAQRQAADRAVADLQAEIARLTEWKEAIIDACVVDWVLSEENANDPRKAINDLLWWAGKIALDPAVSEPAYKLVQRAEQAEAANATLRAAVVRYGKHTADCAEMLARRDGVDEPCDCGFSELITNIALAATVPPETPTEPKL